MNQIIYFTLAVLLLLFAYIVFRIIIRRNYITRGRLSRLLSVMQLIVFIGLFCFPYQFNPAEWVCFWMVSTSSSLGLYLIGLIVLCIGFLVTFGTMLLLGIGRAFGVHIDGLQKVGLSRLSRNPQIIGGYLLVIGISIQWPSLYALGWILMYAIITHLMIMTEEEHLNRIFGKEYENYCLEVPRYLLIKKRMKNSASA